MAELTPELQERLDELDRELEVCRVPSLSLTALYVGPLTPWQLRVARRKLRFALEVTG